ncbi:transmembrane transporter [Mycolicibacterium mageritense DSM 44476 = CIP 104973]|uniref:MFS transporter n=1 Tax=Mycolicibacterium mageritense TaxID=53462 RepID=A0ABN5Y519_MYCME|nr:MFS transporter [Mycolicibacterium mageritense]MCC9180295.1 MFS transporter [Mycolicibacterium mageritense]BBX32685.1 MFS transporter [Mycolicibacterium mageritense]CDO22774.1 transmembrane transporter [Mycolicibacterium mageritense DSM 44476 = CIP 104973]
MNVWRTAGMPALLASAALGFTGFALLLPTAPMWAVRLGTDSFGAGLVNAVLMACTVVAQLLVGRLMRRVGWAVTLAIGLVLLGAPALVHMFAETLWAVLLLAALRGFGFGILTVCGVDGIAGLVPQEHRGRAVGAYGLAIAGPQFVLVPVAPWLAEQVSFDLVFLLAGAPLLGVPLVLMFGSPIPRPATRPRDHVVATRGLVITIGALVVVTASGGAILTFTPQFSGPATGFAALLVMTGMSALSRWRIGGIADRHGAGRFIAPMLYVAAGGLGLIAFGIPHSGAAVIAGALLIGTAYGALQSLTLVEAYAVTDTRAHGAVSVVWNVGFDAGTSLGSFAVGALAAGASFPAAFVVMAVGCALVGLAWPFTRGR